MCILIYSADFQLIDALLAMMRLSRILVAFLALIHRNDQRQVSEMVDPVELLRCFCNHSGSMSGTIPTEEKKT